MKLAILLVFLGACGTSAHSPDADLTQLVPCTATSEQGMTCEAACNLPQAQPPGSNTCNIYPSGSLVKCEPAFDLDGKMVCCWPFGSSNVIQPLTCS